MTGFVFNYVKKHSLIEMTETNNANPTMAKRRSSLQNYLSVHTFDDEKVKLDWKNLNYNILVKG